MEGKSRELAKRHPPPSADELSTAVLQVLASDPERLQVFVSETGQDPATFRKGLEQGSLQAGLMNYLVQNEQLIIAVAEALGRTPDAVAEAAMRVGARPDDDYF